ncbi:uncharacterized protein PV06_11312 [Exophiala oligosperma]|uniref:Uncharacterized protein n=1 Tax=Exophiala oligosperma TaxID=215243 RepID=A0A0D2BG54_9EURO|nr:uncharacterized protein PV06_11312 [Exophiala oligosperma]KIW36457.1 hypothetical protein PV06_11312 [Exophiala oligosperma]
MTCPSKKTGSARSVAAVGSRCRIWSKDTLHVRNTEFPSHPSSDDDNTTVVNANDRTEGSVDGRALRERLQVETNYQKHSRFDDARPSPSQTREEAHRLDDELAMQRAERLTSSESRQTEDRNSMALLALAEDPAVRRLLTSLKDPQAVRKPLSCSDLRRRPLV